MTRRKLDLHAFLAKFLMLGIKMEGYCIFFSHFFYFLQCKAHTCSHIIVQGHLLAVSIIAYNIQHFSAIFIPLLLLSELFFSFTDGNGKKRYFFWNNEPRKDLGLQDTFFCWRCTFFPQEKIASFSLLVLCCFFAKEI